MLENASLIHNVEYIVYCPERDHLRFEERMIPFHLAFFALQRFTLRYVRDYRYFSSDT